MRYPEAIGRLIDAFLKLPGIGRRTAARFAYALLQEGPAASRELAEALLALHQSITRCTLCRQFTEGTLCALCRDQSRDATLLCVVVDDQAIGAIEQTNNYRGRYFVLSKVLDPVEGVAPAELPLHELKARLQDKTVVEVILALDSDTAGEATAMYLRQELAQSGCAVSLLARGLPFGSRLEYADEGTLGAAIRQRSALPQ